MVIALALAVALTSGCSGPGGDDSLAEQAPSTVEGDADLRPVEVTTAAGSAVDTTLAGPHLAIVVDEGGLCGEGTCRRHLELTIDGRWGLTDERGVSTTGAFDASELSQLARGADPGSIVLGPFRGECPTARDGRERTYQVFSPDDPSKTVLQVASCRDQLDADAPLVVALDLLFAAAGR